MTTTFHLRPLLFGAGICAAVLVGRLGPGRTVERVKSDDIFLKGKLEGASLCQDCHTQPTANREANGALDFVLLTEYATWKTQDKHSQAYAVLKGPRGQEMTRLLGREVTDQKTGCLNCHAMNFPEAQRDRSFKIEDGVSCGGCHGPSEHWYGDHSKPQWREKSPQAKETVGMRDLRNPITRAELCMSCHVGNAAQGKVVTHAMYAAGHPPLPSMEVATFSRNQPQHWRSLKDVPYFTMKEVPYLDKKPVSDTVKGYYDFGSAQFQQTKLALISSIVALRESMKLIADRADLDAKEEPSRVWPELVEIKDSLRESVEKRWPELAMAHSDCYACHHDLKLPSWRQERGYGYRLPNRPVIRGKPGRPPVRQWPLAMVELAILHVAKNEAEVDMRFSDLEKCLKTLSAACDSRPFGQPEQVRKAAQQLEQWSQQLISELAGAKYDETTALQLLHKLCSLHAAEFADYETARQIASVFEIVYQEWDPQHKKAPGVSDLLKDLDADLNLKPRYGGMGRLETIDKIVQKLSPRKVTGMKAFADSLLDVTDQERLRGLMENEFLQALGGKIPNEKFTKELQSPDVIEELQKIDDKELKVTLERIGEYNPGRFRKKLKDLSGHLPAK
jgi:hypothetical protein